jgi:hypothetical protein
VESAQRQIALSLRRVSWAEYADMDWQAEVLEQEHAPADEGVHAELSEQERMPAEEGVQAPAQADAD